MRKRWRESAWWTWLRETWRRWTQPLPLGERGERVAELFLRRQGYIIIATRLRERRLGEIDIIAVDGRTVVFVEVKTRVSHDKGHPAEAVDRRKQQRIVHLALRYLKRHDLLENKARFDIVAVTWPDLSRPPVIEHLKNAFEPSGEGSMFA